MEAQEPTTSASERATLQEDIKRIQQALEDSCSEDENHFESDEDALNIDTDNEDEEEDFIPSRDNITSDNQLFSVSQPVASSSQDQEIDDDQLQLHPDPGDGLPFSTLQLVQLDDQSNYLTCLALNRAYQDMIRECLKRIDVLLTQNSERESELCQELEDRVAPHPESSVQRKCQLSAYSVPYFKDSDGMFPPVNQDVRLKSARAEVRAHTMRPSIWRASHKDRLKSAVLADARERLLRPLMNRKEIELGKLEAAHKETEECKYRVKNAMDESCTEEDEEITDSTDKDDYEEGELRPANTVLGKENQKTALEAAVKISQEVEKTIHSRINAIDEEIQTKRLWSENELLQNMDPQKIDWLKISTIEFDGRWDSVSCQQMWMNVSSPSINRAKWSKAENEQLINLVKKCDKQNWPKIVQELGTGRTPFQALQHYELKINKSHQAKSWTPEEDALLMEVVATCRMGNSIPWTQVSFYMDDKPVKACHIRYNQLDPNYKRGKWTTEEDALLLTEIHRHGIKQWSIIADAVPNRTPAQCRERWTKALNPTIRYGHWTYDEDKALLRLMMAEDNSFAKVAVKLNGRTNSQVRKRYFTLKRWEEDVMWLDQQSEPTRQFLMSKPPAEVLKVMKTMLSKRPSQAVQPNTGDATSDTDGVEETAVPDPEPYAPNESEQHDFSMLVQCSSLFYDYIRQQKDRENGDIVVPRPPISKHSTRRCIQRLQLKDELRNLVLRKVDSLSNEAEDLEEGELRLRTDISKQSTEMLQRLEPSMTVRQIIQLSQCLAGKNEDRSLPNIVNNPHPKKRGRKKTKLNTLLDKQLTQAVVDHSAGLTPIKRLGRRRCYFPLEESHVPLEPEEQVKFEARTSGILMRALNVDGQAAWDKFNSTATDSATGSALPLTQAESFRRAKGCLEQMGKLGMFKEQSNSQTEDTGDKSCNPQQQAPPGGEDTKGNNSATPNPPQAAPSGSGNASSKGDNHKEVPLLPPSATTLAGFRTLLLSRRHLFRIAENFYQPRLYRLGNIAQAATKHGLRDPLVKVRETAEFKQLQSRVNALFLWPAFLSSLQVSMKKHTEEERDEDEIQKTKLKLKQRRKYPMVKKHRCVPWIGNKKKGKAEDAADGTTTTGHGEGQADAGVERPAKKRVGRPKGSKNRSNLLPGVGTPNQRPSQRRATRRRQTTPTTGQGMTNSESGEVPSTNSDTSPVQGTSDVQNTGSDQSALQYTNNGTSSVQTINPGTLAVQGTNIGTSGVQTINPGTSAVQGTNSRAAGVRCTYLGTLRVQNTNPGTSGVQNIKQERDGEKASNCEKVDTAEKGVQMDDEEFEVKTKGRGRKRKR